MRLTEDQVRHVAKLANLPLAEEEIVKFKSQLSETLKSAEELNQIGTAKFEITPQVTGLSNIMRPDETALSLTQDQALQNAGSKENGYFKVKAVFEGD